MNKKLEFIWVDDRHQRQASSISMEKRLNVKVDFISLDNKNLESEVVQLLKRKKPDLILMDHSLDRAHSENIRKGSTIAAMIKERWYNCPIISVTEVEMSDMDSFQRSMYDDVFKFRKIGSLDSTLLSIARGFEKLGNKEIQSPDGVLNLFITPKFEADKLRKVLPLELKEKEYLDNSNLSSEIYKWFKGVLTNRPGFLYDRLWVSTLLGLNSAGFNQVETLFEDAKYKGIFADKSNERWWKSRVLSILGKEIDSIGLPWEIGRELIGNKKKYYSKCFASNEDFPETVAAEDETSESLWHPMKLKYTEPHPSYEDMLFFDELRIMKPAE